MDLVAIAGRRLAEDGDLIQAASKTIENEYKIDPTAAAHTRFNLFPIDHGRLACFSNTSASRLTPRGAPGHGRAPMRHM